VYVNDEILLGLENNIADCMQVADADPDIILQAIKKATTYKTTIPDFSNSPDPKDNFLFELALQTEAK
jgi:predicted nucleic acid-binding protein